MNKSAPVGLREVLGQYAQLWKLEPEAYACALERLWEFYGSASQDEAIGVHVGSQFSPAEHDRAHLILGSPTVGAAMERGFRFYNRSNPHSTYEIERRAAGTALVVRHRRPPGSVRQDTEKRLALLTSMVRWFDPDNRAPLLLRIAAPQPRYDRELRGVFGCAVEYGAQEDAVLLDNRAMELPIWGSAHAAHRFQSTVEAPHPEAQVRPRLSAQVAAAIRDGLARGTGHIKQVAHGFAISPRTLERRLKEEAETFWQLLEDVRIGRCLELLQLPDLPRAELARMLGFSNASNFRRTFCRWFSVQTGRSEDSTPDPAGSAALAASEAGSAPLLPSRRERTVSSQDRWLAALGPRACPFVTSRCPPECSIHPAQFVSSN